MYYYKTYKASEVEGIVMNALEKVIGDQRYRISEATTSIIYDTIPLVAYLKDKNPLIQFLEQVADDFDRLISLTEFKFVKEYMTLRTLIEAIKAKLREYDLLED